MLTENDVHYLSGLLLLVSTDSRVRIDLGVPVLDSSIKKKRDVDVLLTTICAGLDEESLGGIEVKDHHRKLDVTHVEQLGAKLRDMPSLSRRAIVSASGYTAPALKKCEAHAIEAMMLQRWIPHKSPLNHVAFPPDFKFSCPLLVPHGPVGLRYVSGSNDSVMHPGQTNRPCSWIVTGVNDPDIERVGQLNGLMLAALQEALPKDVLQELTKGKPIHLTTALNLGEHVLVLDGHEYPIDSVVIEGHFSRRIDEVPADFRALIDAHTGEYYAGAGIAVVPDGSLLGIALTTNAQPKIIYIAAADRARRVIRRQNLGRSEEP